MPGPIPIRAAFVATLLAFGIAAMVHLANAQTSSASFGQKDSQLSVPLISSQQMAPEDRAAAQSWQPAIAQSAQFFGYTLDSSYTYREIACPAAPRHLLLAYEAASANGSISRFTAIVGRGAEEETAGSHPVAQIIPILHFGIVPFIPAIANPHSIEVFNAAISPAPSATEVLSADQAGNQPLLLRSLCYLAMVGEEPASLGPSSADLATIHAPVPTLVFENKGKILQQVSIRSSQNSYQVWALTFQSGGKLLTATRQEHPIDRTPLVLNAANNGSPAGSTGATTISTGAAQISSPALAPTPMPPPAATASAAIAPAAAESTPTEVAAPTPATAAAAAIPAPPVPPANPPAVVASTPVATSVVATPADTAKVERPQPAPLPPPAEAPAPITEPVSTPVSAPATSTWPSHHRLSLRPYRRRLRQNRSPPFQHLSRYRLRQLQRQRRLLPTQRIPCLQRRPSLSPPRRPWSSRPFRCPRVVLSPIRRSRRAGSSPTPRSRHRRTCPNRTHPLARQ